MQFKDEEAKAKWDAQRALEADAGEEGKYGAEIMNTAERWAHNMEREIARLGPEGRDIFFAEPANVERTQRAADTEGVTGAMMDRATLMLVHLWVHGDLLLAWHNAAHIKDPEKAAEATAAGRMVSTCMFQIG